MSNEEQAVAVEQVRQPGFLKYWFNWKFYVIPVLLAFAFLFTDLDKGLKIENVKPLFSFLALVMAFTYKDKIWKKVLIFFAATITLTLAFVIIYIPGAQFLGEKKNEDLLYKQNVQTYINFMLKQNDNFPMKVNEEIEVIKITSSSANSIEEHMKMLSATKAEMLQEFKSTDDFSNFLQASTLNTICFDKNILHGLSLGIVFTIKAYDANNEPIAQYSIDYAKCKTVNKDL